jgi:hypothetical protein
MLEINFSDDAPLFTGSTGAALMVADVADGADTAVIDAMIVVEYCATLEVTLVADDSGMLLIMFSIPLSITPFPAAGFPPFVPAPRPFGNPVPRKLVIFTNPESKQTYNTDSISSVHVMLPSLVIQS